jgi:hypothetical protein
MIGRPAVLFAIVVLAGCGGESEGASRPCIVPEEEMASIWDTGAMHSAPQQNGFDCIYASEGTPVVALSIRTPAQFQAERARFESRGVVLPPLDPVSGFDEDANVDPRYNSLNVTRGNLVVSVQLVGPVPMDPGEQLEIEKRIARSALERL